VSGSDERTIHFARVFDACYPDVCAYVRRRIGHAEVDDVVADSFLVAWRRLDEIPDGRAALPWLYGVARRVLSDHRRSRARRDRLTMRLGGLPPDVVDDEPALDPGRDRAVHQALGRLREADREILRLVGWEELANAEAAVVLGCSVNAATIRLHRARQRFAAALKAVEVEQRAPREGELR
jgi:RNA polymerase sigma-70 factor (ECF subfamily)